MNKNFCLSVIAVFFATNLWAESDGSALSIDAPGVIETGLSSVYRKYADIRESDLLLSHNAVMFTCSPQFQSHWRFVNTMTLEMPQQHQATSLCNAHLGFVLRSTLKQETTPIGNGLCRTEAKYESISVTVYANGAADVGRGSGIDGSTDYCDSNHQYHEVRDLLEQYRNAANTQQVKATDSDLQ